VDFKQKSVRNDTECHYILIKRTIQQEDKTNVNIYALNIGAPKFIIQILLSLQGQRDPDTIIVGDLNTPLSSIDRTSRQKTSTKVS
jgi:hypothetical protein